MRRCICFCTRSSLSDRFRSQNPSGAPKIQPLPGIITCCMESHRKTRVGIVKIPLMRPLRSEKTKELEQRLLYFSQMARALVAHLHWSSWKVASEKFTSNMLMGILNIHYLVITPIRYLFGAFRKVDLTEIDQSSIA